MADQLSYRDVWRTLQTGHHPRFWRRTDGTLRCKACSMPKERGSHPDEHVMGPLSVFVAGHISKNPMNNILSIIESLGAQSVGCSDPCS